MRRQLPLLRGMSELNQNTGTTKFVLESSYMAATVSNYFSVITYNDNIAAKLFCKAFWRKYEPKKGPSIRSPFFYVLPIISFHVIPALVSQSDSRSKTIVEKHGIKLQLVEASKEWLGNRREKFPNNEPQSPKQTRISFFRQSI